MKPELIVALDLPNADQIPAVLEKIPPEVRFFKVGLELFTAAGRDALRMLAEREKNVFLDLKFHDIPRTVARAVRAASDMGACLLTVHACGGKHMLEAAAEAARACGAKRPQLVAVTTLTSLGQEDLRDLGVQRSVADQALALGEMALNAGIDGLVTAVHETAALRSRFGNEPVLVTPGIRLPGDDKGDQKRVATPSLAVQAGASFLVVGRTILNAPNPNAAAQAVLDDMGRA